MIYDPLPDMKQCSKCGQWKQASPLFFAKCNRCHSGITQPCRVCRRADGRQYQHTHHEVGQRAMANYRKVHKADLSAKQKRQREANIEARREWEREYARQWRRKNPEKYRESLKRRPKEVYNPDKMRIRRLRYRVQHREKESAYARQWSAEHPAHVRAIAHRRRARARNLPAQFTVDDEQRALAHFDCRCAVCGRAASAELEIVMDHWIALSDPRPDNPGTVPHNMIPLCHSKRSGLEGCNNTKWRLDPIEWLNARLGDEQAPIVLKNIENYLDLVRR